MTQIMCLVPTRGRPENAVRLKNAIEETASITEALFIVDQDDPKLTEYMASEVSFDILIAPRHIKGVCALINYFSLGTSRPYVAFMGDDHLPRTRNWDIELIDSLNGKPGVAYGNDLHQGINLPTSVVISSELTEALGYFAPPSLYHLYLDNFWKLLGEGVGNLQYRDNVIIEHMHPHAGKSQMDATYEKANSSEMSQRDKAAFYAYVEDKWASELEKLEQYRNV